MKFGITKTITSFQQFPQEFVNFLPESLTELPFSYSNSIIETPGKGVKYVQD